MKAVVCGSRDWPALWFVTAKMIELLPHRACLVITGGARGVDQHAHTEALRLGWETKVMPADWNRYGKRAGYLRNVQMLDELPDVVLAFHACGSRGTAHTIATARGRGIDVRVFTEADLRPDIAALDCDDEPIYIGSPPLRHQERTP